MQRTNPNTPHIEEDIEAKLLARVYKLILNWGNPNPDGHEAKEADSEKEKPAGATAGKQQTECGPDRMPDRIISHRTNQAEQKPEEREGLS